MVPVELLVKLEGKKKSFALLSITIEDDWGMALESTVGVNNVNSRRGWFSRNSSNFFALSCHWWVCCRYW
jgi:hypothetical protein